MSQFLFTTHCEKSLGYRPISGSNKSLVTRLCHDTNVGATCVRSGLRPQIPFLLLVKHSSKQLDVFRTLDRVPERSKYRKAAYRPDAKWSAAAGRPTSPHLNRNSSPVRFSAVSNGHFPSQESLGKRNHYSYSSPWTLGGPKLVDEILSILKEILSILKVIMVRC